MGKTLSLEYPIYKRTPRKSYVNRVKEQIRCRDAYTLGLTGRGVCVAVLDTGAYPHRDFEDRISGFADVVNHRPGPYDDCGHGTHICGIIGGSGRMSGGRYSGIAPGCDLVMVKVLDRKGNGYSSDVLAGISWILERKEKLGIRILNISVGACSKRGMSENSALVKGVNRAWDAGLVVVVAAGNNGPRNMSITTPGISRKVITVGCSDDDREVLVGGNRMSLTDELDFGSYKVLTVGSLSDRFRLSDNAGNKLVPGTTTLQQVIVSLKRETGGVISNFSIFTSEKLWKWTTCHPIPTTKFIR